MASGPVAGTASAAVQAGHHHAAGLPAWALTAGVVVLVAFVVYRAWRGSKKQVSAAWATAIAQVRLEVAAHNEATATATATNTVQVVVSGGPVDNRSVSVGWDDLPATVRGRLADEAVPMVDPIDHDSIEGYFAAVELRREAVEAQSERLSRRLSPANGSAGTEGAGG